MITEQGRGADTAPEPEQTEKRKSRFFDILNSINLSKKDIWDAEVERDYSPFVVDMMMARDISSLMYANQTNGLKTISKEQHYQYMLRSIPKQKRYEKGHKPTKSLESIKTYYGFSDVKAWQASQILTKSDLTYIENLLDKGGK